MSEFKPDAEITMTIEETATGTLVNNLTTTVPGYALDARQGKVLDDKKLDKAKVANNLTVIEEGWALDARQGKWLNENKLGFSDISNDLETDDVNKVLSAAQGKALAGRTAPNAEKLGGKAPQYYLPAVNLLVNSDFLNPVNKRGQTVYNETDSFTIDRWTLDGSGSISILSTGVVIQPITYASLAQIVPNSDSLTGKHMTFAAKTTEYGTVVLNFVFGQGSNISDSTGSMQLIHWFGNILFIRALEGTAKLTVEWAALYEGSYTVETLPPYVSTHPRVEMLKVGNPVQPKNLLDNGYFVDLVNQRGQTSYNTAGYSIDRWYLNKGALTKTSAGIKLSAGSGMYQKLNMRTQLAGKALTAAVCLSDGTLIAQSGVSTSNGVYTEFINAALNNVLIAVYESGDGTIRFGVDATAAEATIQWAALYEGSYTVETLPPYVPKGYAVELNECQRYFFSIDTIRTFANPGESYCGINIIFPVKMRIVPTHTYVTNDGSGFTFDAVSDTCATGWGSMSTGDLKRFTASADL